jgi:phosphate transport system protein
MNPLQQRRQFEADLKELRMHLLKMGTNVQEVLKHALNALRDLDLEVANQLVAGDADINHQEHEIEDLCIRLIATQQPVATDLRKIIAALRIASDLERMADLAVDVAKTARRLHGQSVRMPMQPLFNMGNIIDLMIKNALDAYVKDDPRLAEQLAIQDDEVDQIYRKHVEALFQSGSGTEGETSEQALYLAFVGRYLERIGDHATNIAEGVIYITTGARSDLN